MRYGEIRTGQFYVFVYGLDVTRFVRSWDRTWEAEGDTPMTLQLVLDNNMAGEVDVPGPSPLIYQDFDLNQNNAGRAQEGSASSRSSRDSDGTGPTAPMPGLEPLIDPNLTTVPVHPYKSATTTARKREYGASDDSGIVVPGQCIFRPSDPVRVFCRDPSNPSKWFFEFTGQINAISETELATGDGYVTLQCEGVKRPLRDSRFAANRGYGQNAEAQTTSKDLAFRTWAQDSSGFRGLTIPEIVFILVFGPIPFTETGGVATTLGNGQLGQFPEAKTLLTKRTLFAASTQSAGGLSHETKVSSLSVGTFQYSRSASIVVGTPPPGFSEYARSRPTNTQSYSDRIVRIDGDDALARYQAMVDTEVGVEDLNRLLAPEALPPSGAAQAIADDDVEAAVKLIGSNPHLYPCEGNAVYITSPAALSLADLRDLVDYLPGGSSDATPTFRTRLSAMMDLTERVDFKIIDTPRGDLIIEMPMYHMHPDDFGTSRTSSGRVGVQPRLDQTASGAASKRRIQNAKTRSGRGPFGDRFRLTAADHSGATVSINSAQIKTLIRCIWYDSGQSFAASDKTTRGAQYPPNDEVETNALIRRFGIRDTQANPTLLVQDEAAAQAFAKLTLVRLNSNATSISPASVRFRVGLWPNRPMLIEKRASNLIACCQSVNLSAQPGGENPSPSASTGIDFKYVRHWTGKFDPDRENRKIYALFGTLEADPFDYARFITKAPKADELRARLNEQKKRNRKGPEK